MNGVITMTFFRYVFFAYIFHHLFTDVKCEYLCVCNYNVEWPVYGSVSEKGQTIGYLYEFDCKPLVKLDYLNNNWLAVAFEKQLGYVQKDAQVQVQTCPGHQPEEDKLTTTPHTTSMQTTADLTTETFKETFPILKTTTSVKTSLMPSTAIIPARVSASSAYQSSVNSTMPLTTPATSTTFNSNVTNATPQYITDNTKMNISSTLLSTLLTHTSSTTSKSVSTTVNNTGANYGTTFSAVPSTNISTTSTSVSSTNTMNISAYSPANFPLSSTISPRTAFTTLPMMSPTYMAQTTSHVRIQYDLIVGDASKCMANDDGIQGYFISKYGSNCYELVTGFNRQWNFSEMYCILHGGHLLSVSSRAEEEYIYQLLTWRNVTEPVWTGLNDQKYEEIFRWSSGEPVIFLDKINWRNGRKGPDYYMEDCVILDPDRYPGEWDDVDCYSSHAFICKYNIEESVKPAIVG